MHLDSLFNKPILSQVDLGGHASHVWLVKTLDEEVVVRASGVNDEIEVPFLDACRQLYGTYINNTFDLEFINKEIESLSSIPIPQVLRKGMVDGFQVVVVERMNGSSFQFPNQPSLMLERFGESLAKIHSKKFKECGNVIGTFRYPVDQFHKRLIEIIQVIVEKHYKNEKQIKLEFKTMLEILKQLPSPKYASYIMVDMDSRQLLSNGQQITAIVDTEAYVIAPRELDLISLECSFDLNAAAAFKKGYESVLSFPDLSPYREVYRYFYRLLQVKGPIDYTDWMSKPSYFEQK
ncbi:hypothetical protein [Chengkuizengella axinellae]|uniref:Aminoglycoside phosphotransferase domain-containing protein n=1 Tax=Chengkuizengella axinellae TaxID=3064388 RepID=A0ABT9IY36_9BACL|nr:hypothetical protein [Chengkuizengella sp. 2205SS18-9]MDP5274276.1 hypothetical protein [Chengkuizengella sp. 2205SS18-9]